MGVNGPPTVSAVVGVRVLERDPRLTLAFDGGSVLRTVPHSLVRATANHVVAGASAKPGGARIEETPSTTGASCVLTITANEGLTYGCA